MLFSALVFAGVTYFDDREAQKEAGTRGDVVASTSETQVQSDNPAVNSGGYVRRPNLAVDENASGLRELTVPDESDLPTIVPRRRPENVVRRQILSYLPDEELIEKKNGRLLPVKSPDGLRALDVYSRQADTEGNFGVARIVLIVGGLGISQSSTQQAIDALPPGVTLAFAPYGNSLSRWTQKARKQGHELLLQLPMEPFGYPQTTAGAHSILSVNSAEKNMEALYWNLGRITNYVGVLNYLGGKMLTSPEPLKSVFQELSFRGLAFVDDGSIRNSMAEMIAKNTDLPFARAHLSIDSLRTRQAIAAKLKVLEEQAKRTGLAIGVGSAFPETISQIAIFLKTAKQRGLELTPVSAIVSEPRG